MMENVELGKSFERLLMSQNIWELRGSLLIRQMKRAQLVKHTLKRSKAKFILDVGCAEGFVTSFLSQLPAYVIGIDIDESIKIAKTKVKNAYFVYASITHLPFKDGSFEAVTLLEILEHLPNAAINKGIAEVDRVLTSGGTLIVSVPYKEKITYTRCIHCGKLTPLWGHIQSFDEGKLKSLLPKNYAQIEKKHLPNIELILCNRLIGNFPLQIWLIINKILGLIRKGYWLVLRYKKS
jgi:ubiquinone/menaquinone biosynthesis C-methylase UbiE